MATIVLIDDDRPTRGLVSALLSRRGHAVEQFGDFRKAHRYLEENPPDLLIVGVQQAEGGGLDLIARVRNYHASNNFPIVILSGLRSESDILRGYAAGADEFLIKPFKPAELQAKIAVLLGKSERDAAAEEHLPEEPALPSQGGLIFGRYHKQRVLGRGGFGTVYEARDTVEGSQVALKVLSALQGRHAENRFRFLREAYALSGIQDPGIVKIFDFGFEEGRLYYSMELIVGPTLDSEAAHQPLGEYELVRLMLPLAEALVSLRKSNLIHRDVKPANIVLRGGKLNEPVLIDFGLSKRSFDRGLTDPDLVMGTPGYLPPELYRGLEHDYSCDLYGLGMVARYALTGVHLWSELDSYSLYQRLLLQDVPLPGLANQNLQALLRRLLEREREQRYQSAEELLKDLRAIELEFPAPREG